MPVRRHAHFFNADPCDRQETVARVVDGVFNMQRRWMAEQGLHWCETRAQQEAQDMFDLIFNMKFLPPGRGECCCRLGSRDSR